MPALEQNLTATLTDSLSVAGWRIGWGRNHQKAALFSDLAAWQIIRVPTTGTISATLEIGIAQSDGTITWFTKGTAVTVDGTVTEFTVVPGALYRIVHGAGTNVEITVLIN